MKKILLASACVVALTSAAFAQSSQPQGGANQSPTSPTAETSKDKADSMKKHNSGAMDNKGAMNNNASQGTTGNTGSSQGSDKK